MLMLVLIRKVLIRFLSIAKIWLVQLMLLHFDSRTLLILFLLFKIFVLG